MSTAAVSTGSIYQELQAFYQQRRTDLQQLGQALQSGDLAGAQKDYSAIVSLGQSGPSASGNPFSSSQREQDFAAIGQALQSGDLAGAQQAFTALQSTLKHQRVSDPPPVSTSTDSSIYQQLLSFSQQRRTDLQQLGKALQSGDLAGAQQAFNAIVSLGQSGPLANGDAFRGSQREQDFAAIGQALQSGDVSSAQKAFATLESTFHQDPPPSTAATTNPGQPSPSQSTGVNLVA